MHDRMIAGHKLADLVFLEQEQVAIAIHLFFLKCTLINEYDRSFSCHPCLQGTSCPSTQTSVKNTWLDRLMISATG